MYTFETKIRVRYAETDQMGYVYYGNYATYYEVARVEMLRSLGTSYKAMEDRGVMLPVTELQVRYHKPILYDEEVRIRVSIPELPAVRIRFQYELFNQKGELANYGETTLVFVDMKKNRPCRAPDDFLETLSPYFQ
ncbi:MAG TPA: thioesterase family protein [Sphingobacteriaceae bacterium]|nr:thioesterase family protein [Sphingobacteriaceae bacterium]